MIIYLVGCIVSLVLLLYFTRDAKTYSIFFLIPVIVLTVGSWLAVVGTLVAQFQIYTPRTKLWDRIFDYEVKNPFHKK